MEKEKLVEEVFEVIAYHERVNEKFPGNVKIENVVGDIVLKDCQVNGTLFLSSATGNIILSHCQVQKLQVRTGQGNIYLHDLTLSKEQEAIILTNSGMVTLDQVVGYYLSLRAYRSKALFQNVTLEKTTVRIENGDVLFHKVHLTNEDELSTIEILSGDCTLSETQYHHLAVYGLVTDLYCTEIQVPQKKLTFETQVGSRKQLQTLKNTKE